MPMAKGDQHKNSDQLQISFEIYSIAGNVWKIAFGKALIKKKSNEVVGI